MLNLIRRNALGFQRLEKLVAITVGLFMGLGLLLQREFDAQDALVHAQSKAHVHGATNVHSEITDSEIVQAKKILEEEAVRLSFLTQRQAARDDLTAAQAAWFLSRIAPNRPLSIEQPKLKFHSQQLQQGRLTWEGLATQPQELDNLLKALNQFQRWKQPPALIRLQSESVEPNATARKGLAFVVQGDVQNLLPKGP